MSNPPRAVYNTELIQQAIELAKAKGLAKLSAESYSKLRKLRDAVYIRIPPSDKFCIRLRINKEMLSLEILHITPETFNLLDNPVNLVKLK